MNTFWYVKYVVLAVNSHHITGLDRPWWFQEVEAPTTSEDNRHTKVVRLSVLRTGRLYPPGNIPGSHFCSESDSTPGALCRGKDYVNEKFQ